MKDWTIHHGDCIEVLRTLENESVDAVITDPPYGTTACGWDAVIPFKPMWEELKRISKPDSAICLFGSQPFTAALIASNFPMFRYEWIWDKSVGMGQNAKRMPIKVHENLVVFSRLASRYYPQFGIKEHFRPFPKTYKTELMDLSKCSRDLEHLESGKKFPTSVIAISGRSEEINPLNRVHPTQKPVELLCYLVRTYTNEGETVLDFTMGSGSTGVASLLEGRKFIGIEKDAKYFRIAERRLKATLHQPSLI